jgi:hypothetical protein
MPCPCPDTHGTGRPGRHRMHPGAIGKSVGATVAAALTEPMGPTPFKSIRVSRRRSRQLGYDLQELRFRPCAHRSGRHIAQRTDRQHVFRDIVAVRRIDDGYDIGIATSEINMLDINAHFFGKIAGTLDALRGVLDRTPSLIGSSQRYYELHDLLPKSCASSDCNYELMLLLIQGQAGSLIRSFELPYATRRGGEIAPIAASSSSDVALTMVS